MIFFNLLKTFYKFKLQHLSQMDNEYFILIKNK